MDGDIKFGGVSTKEKIFLVVGERMRKFFASGRLLLIPCSSRQNSAIWFKFGAKSENLISYNSL